MKKTILLLCIMFLMLTGNALGQNSGGWSPIDLLQNAQKPTATPTATPIPTETPVSGFWNTIFNNFKATVESEPEPENITRPTDEPESDPVIIFRQPSDTAVAPAAPTDEPEAAPLIIFKRTAPPQPTDTAVPTAKPLPTSTPLPTATPDPFIGLETQKGITYKWYSCGSDLKFMVVYQPIMTKAQSGQTAEGMFILFRAQIQNLTGRPLTGLKYESFTLTNERSGSVYPLSAFFSTVTSSLWSLGLFRDTIPANGILDTYMVFDVQGAYNDPWVLNFAPTERISNEMFTPIRITLPPVSQQ